jgi:FkbM family methyltransferase
MYKFLRRVFGRIKWQLYLIGVSDLSGRMIRKRFKNRIPTKGGLVIDVSNPLITNRLAATIFLGAYEKNELSFIARYLDPKIPTLELGASIGVTSVFIAKQSFCPVYCVEANPDLIPSIERQFELNKLSRFKIYNVAISAAKGAVYLRRQESSNTGMLVSDPHGSDLMIQSTSVATILAGERIADFNMVCDIEGSEVDFLLHEPESLKNCKLLIIELHQAIRDGKTWLPDDIDRLIRDIGFSLVDRKEEVFVYSK